MKPNPSAANNPTGTMRNLVHVRRRSPLFDRVVATTGTCTLLFGLAATAANASTLRPALTGRLTMNVFTFTTPVMQPVIAAFEKLYPNVHIEAANVVNTPSTYVPLLQTERLAGNEPMIDETYDVLTPTLEVDGLLGDLTRRPEGRPALPAELLATDLRGLVHPAQRAPPSASVTFSPWPTRPMRPSSCTTRTSSKRPACHFPQNGWTWSQMLADAAKLKIGSGASQTQYGICERPDWQAEYNPVLKAYGVNSFTETKATLDTPAALKAWTLDDRPNAERRRGPEAQQQAKNGSSGCEPFFESGEAAMSIEVRGNLPGLQQSIGTKFQYNVVPMPSITAANGTQVIPTGGGSLGWGLAPGCRA